MASVEYTNRITQRTSITMEELSKWQRWYREASKDLYADPEITEAVELLFDKIDSGKILVEVTNA